MSRVEGSWAACKHDTASPLTYVNYSGVLVVTRCNWVACKKGTSEGGSRYKLWLHNYSSVQRCPPLYLSAGPRHSSWEHQSAPNGSPPAAPQQPPRYLWLQHNSCTTCTLVDTPKRAMRLNHRVRVTLPYHRPLPLKLPVGPLSARTQPPLFSKRPHYRPLCDRLGRPSYTSRFYLQIYIHSRHPLT